MNINDPEPGLPSAVTDKLHVIQRRARTLALLAGLARTGTVLIGVMLAAMLVDFAVGWFDPRARYIITSLALGTVAILFVLWCGLPLARRRTIVATARLLIASRSGGSEDTWRRNAEAAPEGAASKLSR